MVNSIILHLDFRSESEDETLLIRILNAKVRLTILTRAKVTTWHLHHHLIRAQVNILCRWEPHLAVADLSDISTPFVPNVINSLFQLSFLHRRVGDYFNLIVLRLLTKRWPRVTDLFCYLLAPGLSLNSGASSYRVHTQTRFLLQLTTVPPISRQQ